MFERPRQTNCQQEPPYPGHATAVFFIRFPDLTSHYARSECPVEGPHLIAECSWFSPTDGAAARGGENAD